MPDTPAYEKKFDPALFEWEPEESSEEEMFADLAAIGKKPEFIKEVEVRQRYIAYLAKQQG